MAMKGKLNTVGLNSFKFVPLMFHFLCQKPFMYVVIVCVGFVTRFYKGLSYVNYMSFQKQSFHKQQTVNS